MQLRYVRIYILLLKHTSTRSQDIGLRLNMARYLYSTRVIPNKFKRLRKTILLDVI